MSNTLENKTVVVTGGTGSLGAAVTKQALEQGAEVWIPVFDEDELEHVDFDANDNVHFESGIDLTDEDQASEFYELVQSEAGSIWASVQIAGGFGMGTIEDTGQDAFMKQMRLNTLTCYNACRAAIQRMKKAGKGGRLANIASRPAIESRQGAGMSAYTASKAAVAALTESLAEELADEDILVNAVAPSIIDTPANRSAMEGADFSKWPKPDEIATQILYLISPENKVTRGAIVPVYGKS